MTSLVQSSIFDFKPRERPAQWLMRFRDERSRICRTDAEIFARSVGSIPYGGMHLRCMEIDHSRVYNEWCPWASAEIWGLGDLDEHILMDHEGRVEWWLDPYPFERYWKDGKQVREHERFRIESAEIEGGTLRITLEGAGDWLAEICPDSEIKWCDIIEYRPDFNLEHFAIECYRHRVPAGMMGWLSNRVWATEALRPFYRAISEDEAKKIDLMGPIEGSWAPNPEYDEILACARRIGIALKLRHGPPALDNLAMYPIEHTCASCIHKGSSNKDACWKLPHGCSWGTWKWDRKTPAKPYRKGKKLAGTPRGCDGEEEGCGC